MRCATARVLPVPAPASTQTGPRLASATSRCSGSSDARTASGPVILLDPVSPAVTVAGPARTAPSGDSTAHLLLLAILAYRADARGNPAAGWGVTALGIKRAARGADVR